MMGVGSIEVEEVCRVCRKPVRVQIFKNTRLCSQKCQKGWEKMNEPDHD